jgi:hypothetical protein
VKSTRWAKKGCRVGLRIVLSRLARRSLALRPAHSRRHQFVTRYTEGFGYFVTSIAAPVAFGWSVRRVTAHTHLGHSRTGRHTLVHQVAVPAASRSRAQRRISPRPTVPRRGVGRRDFLERASNPPFGKLRRNHCVATCLTVVVGCVPGSTPVGGRTDTPLIQAANPFGTVPDKRECAKNLTHGE